MRQPRLRHWLPHRHFPVAFDLSSAITFPGPAMVLQWRTSLGPDTTEYLTYLSLLIQLNFRLGAYAVTRLW